MSGGRHFDEAEAHANTKANRKLHRTSCLQRLTKTLPQSSYVRRLRARVLIEIESLVLPPGVWIGLYCQW